jgi:hypothetical protein
MKNKKNEKGRRPNKAMVAQEEENDEDEEDSVDEDDEDDYDNDTYITTTYNTVCAHACVHDEIKPTLSHANVASLVRDPIIIDSGARGANVTGDKEGLTDTWKDPTERVQGLTGAPEPVSTVGHLPFAGKTLVIKTDVNLLAMHNLLPDADAHFKGDRTHIEFFRGDGVSCCVVRAARMDFGHVRMMIWLKLRDGCRCHRPSRTPTCQVDPIVILLMMNGYVRVKPSTCVLCWDTLDVKDLLVHWRTVTLLRPTSLRAIV